MTLSKAIRKLEKVGVVLRAPSVKRADDVFFGALSARELASCKALMVVLIAGK